MTAEIWIAIGCISVVAGFAALVWWRHPDRREYRRLKRMWGPSAARDIMSVRGLPPLVDPWDDPAIPADTREAIRRRAEDPTDENTLALAILMERDAAADEAEEPPHAT